MEVKFTAIQFSNEQLEVITLYQLYNKYIQYHISNGLWDAQKDGKWFGSYVVNLKPDTGMIENAIGYKHFGT